MNEDWERANGRALAAVVGVCALMDSHANKDVLRTKFAHYAELISGVVDLFSVGPDMQHEVRQGYDEAVRLMQRACGATMT